jgi:hypothetical protein
VHLIPFRPSPTRRAAWFTIRRVGILRKLASPWLDAEAEAQKNYTLKRTAEFERLLALLVGDESSVAVADCELAGPYRGAATMDTKGLIAVTNRRILFLSDRGKSVERVGFDEIASVSARVGITGRRTATFSSWGESAQVQLFPAEEPCEGHG